MGIELTRLFVPLMPAELEYVVASNGLELPTRLAREHLIVTLGYEHAMALGRDQATSGPGSASFLLKVEVVSAYLQRLEPRVVGRGSSVELWIPAAEIPGLNPRIARPIRLLHALYGPEYPGRTAGGQGMFGDDIQLFLMVLAQAPALRALPIPSGPERWQERLRLMRRGEVGKLRRMILEERAWVAPDVAGLKRRLGSIGIEELREEWQRAVGFRPSVAPRSEGWDERLLRVARFWLLSNLAYWRATGRVGRAKLVDLAERLQRTCPHPAPTLRATLLD